MGKPCHHALSGLLGCHICHPMPSIPAVDQHAVELAAARRETEEAHVGFLALLHTVHLLVEKRAPYEVLDAVVDFNAKTLVEKVKTTAVELAEKVKATVAELVALTTERDALRAALRSVRGHLASGPFKKHRFDCPAAHAPMCAGIGGGDGRDYTCKCGFAEVDYVMKFVVSEAALAPKKEAP